MSSEDRKKDPSKTDASTRDAGEETGVDLFGKPGSPIFGEDSTPSLLLVEPVENPSNGDSIPSLGRVSLSDTPLDPDDDAIFGN